MLVRSAFEIQKPTALHAAYLVLMRLFARSKVKISNFNRAQIKGRTLFVAYRSQTKARPPPAHGGAPLPP